MLVFKNHEATQSDSQSAPIQHLTVVLPFLYHETLVSDVLLTTYQSVCLSVCQSVCQSVCVFCLCVCLSVSQFVCLFLCRSVHSSVSQRGHLSVRQRGRMVKAPDLKSGRDGFEFRSDHLAGVVSRWTLVQLLGHACK